MRLISHQTHLDALPASDLKDHIQKRFDTLFETEDDLLPNIILADEGDDITRYSWIGKQGLVSDLWEEHEPGHPEFCRPYEWVSYLPSLQLYEALLLINNEDGYWIMIPEAVVEAHPDLHWVLTAEEQGGLSSPQPM